MGFVGRVDEARVSFIFEETDDDGTRARQRHGRRGGRLKKSGSEQNLAVKLQI